MSFPHRTRSITCLGGSLLLLLLLTASIQAAGFPQGTGYRGSTDAHLNVSRVSYHTNVLVQGKIVQDKRLAPTAHVLASLPPTTILQFPLVPSGVKTAFPQATGLMTIVRGDPTTSSSDTVTVDVQHMPPNITFTIFFIELANKPFGNVEYVADLTTRGDGSGETVFRIISLVAFAMDARHPGTSEDGNGTTSGINLNHLGMWFSSLSDAQKVLNNTALKGTIFDGGNPPLHAGPQAMTDGQTAPVF